MHLRHPNTFLLLQLIATHCSTLQHTATYCNTPNTLHHTITQDIQTPSRYCSSLPHTAAHCNILQHTQHTATKMHVTIACYRTITAYCIWSVIFSFSNLNRRSSSLGLFYHIPLKRDQGDEDWRLRFYNDTPNATGCTSYRKRAYFSYVTHVISDRRISCLSDLQTLIRLLHFSRLEIR